MSRNREVLRKAKMLCRKQELRSLIKIGYVLRKCRPKWYRYSLLLKNRLTSRGRERTDRIFYIDYFHPTNANLYWLNAFCRFGAVEMFDINEDRRLLRERIRRFRPTHVHLGGSVKNNVIPIHLLFDVKKELKCTISVFYGDAEYSPYHRELAEVVDDIYVTNRTHIERLNEANPRATLRYMPCPTEPRVFKEHGSKKTYEVIFIGNNNQPNRLPILKRVAEHFDLIVFGNGWKGTGLVHRRPVYGRKFSITCSKAQICLGITDPRWTELEGYFSVRLINTLATRSFIIQTYSKGLEKLFRNHENLVWYEDEDQLLELIAYYLNHEEERERIAYEGQKVVYQNFTYEKSVRSILENAWLRRTL